MVHCCVALLECVVTCTLSVVWAMLPRSVGVLVESMRQGYWVILDELNLAPTEVLEALNRVRQAAGVALVECTRHSPLCAVNDRLTL